VLPDNKLIAIALSDSFSLGVLSSDAHCEWALASGSWLGVGNDPVYVKTRCFETFPFPSDDTGLTPELTTRIRALAEQLDAHRKTQQAAHPELTLTGMYNVLEKLRSGEALDAKDMLIHTQGLVSVLKSLHDDLDAAVLAAYDWHDLQGALLAPPPRKLAQRPWKRCWNAWWRSTPNVRPKKPPALCAGCARTSSNEAWAFRRAWT
jgi:hypothetical protein